MAVASRPTLTDLQIPKLWKHHRDISPERTKVWTEPKLRSDRRVPVVYYLSRNGHLEHPHFMEVPLSSSEGLYLRGSKSFSPMAFISDFLPSLLLCFFFFYFCLFGNVSVLQMLLTVLIFFEEMVWRVLILGHRKGEFNGGFRFSGSICGFFDSESDF